jgi:hypothetical protein
MFFTSESIISHIHGINEFQKDVLITAHRFFGFGSLSVLYLRSIVVPVKLVSPFKFFSFPM